jgi:hypothetical protein
MRLMAYRSVEMSNAFPIVNVMFSFSGVWSIESSPINSKELSVVSSLKTLTVPLGKGIPNPTFAELLNLTTFEALIPFRVIPPALMVMRLYESTLTLNTLGRNSICFDED